MKGRRWRLRPPPTDQQREQCTHSQHSRVASPHYLISLIWIKEKRRRKKNCLQRRFSESFSLSSSSATSRPKINWKWAVEGHSTRCFYLKHMYTYITYIYTFLMRQKNHFAQEQTVYFLLFVWLFFSKLSYFGGKLSARIEKLLVTGRALVTVFMFAGNVEAQVFTAHTPPPPLLKLWLIEMYPANLLQISVLMIYWILNSETRSWMK